MGAGEYITKFSEIKTQIIKIDNVATVVFLNTLTCASSTISEFLSSRAASKRLALPIPPRANEPGLPNVAVEQVVNQSNDGGLMQS